MSRRAELRAFRDCARQLLESCKLHVVGSRIDSERAYIAWDDSDGNRHTLAILEDYVRPAWRLQLDHAGFYLRHRPVNPTSSAHRRELSCATHEVEAALTAWLSVGYSWTEAGRAARQSKAG